MPHTGASKHVVGIQFSARAGIKRPYPALEITPQLTKFLKMSDEIPADAILLPLGKLSCFRHGSFKQACHIHRISYFAAARTIPLWVPNLPKAQRKKFVLCLDNEGYTVSLAKRKIYVALSDPASEKRGLLRIVDESGEDYLYPKELLRAVALSPSVKKAE